MQKCRICGGAEFYKEAGYYFCQTCQTQNEDIREEVLELRVDSSTRLRKTKIRQLRSDRSGLPFNFLRLKYGKSVALYGSTVIHISRMDSFGGSTCIFVCKETNLHKEPQSICKLFKYQFVELLWEELGWTSWELYNFVLIGLTNELLELGVPTDIKLTVLQLWATYLGKIEVAFISTKKKCMPKLARRYKKRDAEIIYGKVQSQKRYRKRKRAGSSTNTSVISGGPSEGSSSMRELNKNKRLLATADYDRYLQSQGSSEADGLSMFSQSAYSVQSSSVKSSDNEGKVQFSSHAKEEAKKIEMLSKNVPRDERTNYRARHVTTRYKMGPHMVTPMRLWAIIYLALRIHDQPIQLGDMLRYGREGHLSYYKLDHLLPPEISLTAGERSFLTQNVEITHKGLRRIVASMAKFLGVWDVDCPNFLPLVSRYCQELGLPRGIRLYAERLIALSPPKMAFDRKKSCIPNYEGRAMAFIVVVLKTLLGLDGVTEYRISKVAEKINRKAAVNGYKKLMNGETSVDAVEAALWWLECDEFFNCSYGSVLNEIGKVQMDASIMDGFTFKCGSVAAVSDIEHPITLAKYVLNNFPNTIFVGDGAKNLAKHANMNWLSEGNMEAPIARLAFRSEQKKGELDALVDNNQSLLDLDMLTSKLIEELATKGGQLHYYVESVGRFYRLGVVISGSLHPLTQVDANLIKNSFGTVGCVAFDGYSVAAGTTTGGLNKKLVGRVGDTPILGCGTYATRNVGCSLTGHGESIIKLGLARAIVEDVERNVPSEEALHEHFSCMLKQFDRIGGGIVLQSNGRWATYFTSDKMPYAAIENDLITYGARSYEEKREMYKSDAKDCDIAIERGFLSDKLFSFDEWQRYIECRKTILVHAHFPTKMKYSPDSDGIDDLYLKFLEFITSKSSRQEPEMKNSKHFLPEELINAMTRHVTSLNIDDLSPQAIDIFPPSLTPLHSYFQHLLDHPLYDIPNVARNDFLLTKVGYMTKPDSLLELATKCDIELEIIDSNVHFLEKSVPPFEQARMPNVNELKQLIDVQDDSKDRCETGSESLNDYLHAKIPCTVKVDLAKKEYYDDTRSAKKSAENIDAGDNLTRFTFGETLPNGKLAIPSDDDSESDEDATFNNSTNQASMLMENNKVWDKYNLQLSQAEKESVRKSTRPKRLKTRVTRNGEDELVKGGGLSARMIRNGDDSFAAKEDASFYSDTEASLISHTRFQLENRRERESPLGRDINISDIDFDIDIDDINIGSDLLDSKDFANLSDITFLGESKDGKRNKVKGDHRFFRPFKEYWMYHCVFSRVKPKNFSVFEKSLPRSFRWLLNECANIVEMTAEDLYEEVCLIESYHSHPLRSSISKEKSGGDVEPLSKIVWNFILNKW